MNKNKIDSFQGENRWASNFWYTRKGFNVETWYQSYKTLDLEEREKVKKMKPGDAKRWSHTIEVRPDWEDIKVDIMKELVLFKFENDEELKQKLLNTGDAELIEGNTWHDNFWGACICERCSNKEKKNTLGKILMEVREKLRNLN